MFKPDKAAEVTRINIKIRCRPRNVDVKLETKFTLTFLVRWTKPAHNSKESVDRMLRDNFLADYGDEYIFFGILYRADEIVEEAFRIELPEELVLEQTIDESETMAINQAREQADLYCMPCNWLATELSGSAYWVLRIRKDGFEL